MFLLDVPSIDQTTGQPAASELVTLPAEVPLRSAAPDPSGEPSARYQTTLLGFARQDDGTIALHSIHPASGAVRDLGARLSAGTRRARPD